MHLRFIQKLPNSSSSARTFDDDSLLSGGGRICHGKGLVINSPGRIHLIIHQEMKKLSHADPVHFVFYFPSSESTASSNPPPPPPPFPQTPSTRSHHSPKTSRSYRPPSVPTSPPRAPFQNLLSLLSSPASPPLSATRSTPTSYLSSGAYNPCRTPRSWAW